MISKDDMKCILESYKTPFYVFQEAEFLNNYKELLSAFRSIYSNYQIAYSYKTNYTPYVCKLVQHEGGYAEVVSDMEYTLAKKLGYENKKIVYNGPCKGDVLEEHLLNGGINNIDNYQEAARITEIADRHPGVNFSVGIRINSDIGANYTSRFGLELCSEELDKTVSLLKSRSNIRVSGMHCHVSRARGLAAWAKRIDNLLLAADKYIDGIPDYIDLGSGMFAVMEESLANQFDIPIPNYEEYANVVARKMLSKYGNCENSPMLFTEPGTTVIAKYFSLVTSVVQIKTIGEKVFATVDSSIDNLGSICKMKKLPNYVLRGDDTIQEGFSHADLMGYTCLEQDCIYRDFDSTINVGDVIVFDNVGGYSIVSKPPFIHPNCAVYAINQKGKLSLIKREESFDDIFNTFVF